MSKFTAKSHHLSRNAFTLIELLVTVGILGVLAGVIIVVINPDSKKNQARDAVLKEVVSSIAASVESYKNIEGAYPAMPSVLLPYLSGFTSSPATGFQKAGIYVGGVNGGNIFWYSTAGSECLNAVSNLDATKYVQWRPGTGVLVTSTITGCGTL